MIVFLKEWHCTYHVPVALRTDCMQQIGLINMFAQAEKYT